MQGPSNMNMETKMKLGHLQYRGKYNNTREVADLYATL